MTIDESIQRENNIAEENQKIVDTEIVFDDVSLSQLYCDDTEVIEEHLSNYRKCAEYHEQIAEWLEELKALREKNETLKALYEDARKEGNVLLKHERNKAIDDFVNACKEDILCQTFGLHIKGIERIAEQLKAGGENEI